MKEGVKMYINPFLAGILATLFTEVLLIIGIGIYFGIKQSKDK